LEIIYRENLKENVVEEASGTNYDYDVFISYAHANEETCKIIKEVLEGKMPDIKLFIDRQQLHTGIVKFLNPFHSCNVCICLL